MCGITGIFNVSGSPVAAKSIRLMCDAMSHRGPDDEGIYINGSIGLGHRRLAIIDLTPAGHQPMANEDGSVVIVYNGEIYNFQKLRTELEALGHRFHSRTDTEVVIHSYEQWGENCIHKFNGMFAFALWDSNRAKLFLSRDRYGIKPLYYYYNGDTFIFASEIKAILRNKEVKRELSFKALNEYFTFQNIYSDNTLFQDIKIIPAGYHAVLSTSIPKLRLTRYWDFDFSRIMSPHQISFAEASAQINKLFQQAVIRQLVSDVPLGSYLSGGMDSGSIVSVASRAIPRLMTFTGGFDLSSVSGLELNFDEREASELMASAFRTEHYEMVLHSGDMAWVLPRLIWHLEDLRMGMSYQNWYIAQLASKFVKVVLSGAGGDELFAGYPWRYRPMLNAGTDDEFDGVCYRYWQRLLPEEDKPDFFTEDAMKEISNYPAFEVFRAVMEPLKQPASLDSGATLTRSLYFEAKTFLHGLFIVEDKISMAHSLETRVPFLDNDLVDFVLTIPAEYKLNLGSFTQAFAPDAPAPEAILSSDGKYVLRHAMGTLIPKAILDRQKQGFSPPDESWYRGETMNYIREILLDPKTLGRGYFKPPYIRKLVDEHTAGKVNHRLLIWSLLCFEWWNRQFMDRNMRQSS
jgi:asparagine synthase (glutamine-hydrolysing)